MGWLSWLGQWFGWGAGSSNRTGSSKSAASTSPSFHATTTPSSTSSPAPANKKVRRARRRTARPWLTTLRYRPKRQSVLALEVRSDTPPYRYARIGSRRGRYIDQSRDGDAAKLASRGLPVFHTPEELANWLGMPVKTIAWLTHRCTENRPATVKQSHYHYQWVSKRSGGFRLIEAPKATLKQIQRRILTDILNRVAPHAAAHGFQSGRSIITNAQPHAGQAVVVRMDLENFYPTVRFARVVAIFRSLGYSREAAQWLARLTTNAVPWSLPLPQKLPQLILPYTARHLPQGACTSPALANLSAFSLDVRLAGLARSFHARYTRYADDISFSGGDGFGRSLHVFIPLVNQVVAGERFRFNRQKRKVLRAHQRQMVCGVVVNERSNISRADFDRLKATLTNCVRHGPSSQNRDGLPNFAAVLAGRIAHVAQLNPSRGEKLQALYRRIDWSR